MNSRALSGWLTAALLLTRCIPAAAGDDVTLLRVFLTDGTSLACYGEPARIGERVIFSIPTAATPNPPLHLVDLAAARVDWERTNRYSRTVETVRYIETRAELDYAELSGQITKALAELTATDDVARRLEIAESARKTLAGWPQTHYDYKLNEVRQMVALLDEAIADLRVAAGAGQFTLTLAAFADPPNPEPLAPPSTPKETIEQVLLAARVADSAAERTALLETALTNLERDAAVVPTDWRTAVRTATKTQLEGERRTDRAYQELAVRTIRQADLRARVADVGSLARLVTSVRASDLALGGQRPETVRALIAAIETRLDAARRLQLARDRWALRAPVLRQYHAALKAPLDNFAKLEPALLRIKLLSGSSPRSLRELEIAVNQILRQTRALKPPPEYRAPQALLISAAQMAANASRIRREAAATENLARAWDASSAAAGALMLGERARSDLQNLVRPPQLQ